MAFALQPLDLGMLLQSDVSEPEDSRENVAFCRYLSGLTPLDAHTWLLPDDQLRLVHIIQQHVPGYGPH